MSSIKSQYNSKHHCWTPLMTFSQTQMNNFIAKKAKNIAILKGDPPQARTTNCSRLIPKLNNLKYLITPSNLLVISRVKSKMGASHFVKLFNIFTNHKKTFSQQLDKFWPILLYHKQWCLLKSSLVYSHHIYIA